MSSLLCFIEDNENAIPDDIMQMLRGLGMAAAKTLDDLHDPSCFNEACEAIKIDWRCIGDVRVVKYLCTEQGCRVSIVSTDPACDVLRMAIVVRNSTNHSSRAMVCGMRTSVSSVEEMACFTAFLSNLEHDIMVPHGSSFWETWAMGETKDRFWIGNGPLTCVIGGEPCMANSDLLFMDPFTKCFWERVAEELFITESSLKSYRQHNIRPVDVIDNRDLFFLRGITIAAKDDETAQYLRRTNSVVPTNFFDFLFMEIPPIKMHYAYFNNMFRAFRRWSRDVGRGWCVHGTG